jgi:hypothetical protein
VAAASDCHFETKLSREVDGVYNVSHAMAPGYQYGVFVDQTVVDFSSRLVTSIGDLKELPRKPTSKFKNRVGKG